MSGGQFVTLFYSLPWFESHKPWNCNKMVSWKGSSSHTAVPMPLIGLQLTHANEENVCIFYVCQFLFQSDWICMHLLKLPVPHSSGVWFIVKFYCTLTEVHFIYLKTLWPPSPCSFTPTPLYCPTTSLRLPPCRLISIFNLQFRKTQTMEAHSVPKISSIIISILLM